MQSVSSSLEHMNRLEGGNRIANRIEYVVNLSGLR